MYGFGNTPADRDYSLQDYCDGAIEIIDALGMDDVKIGRAHV